MNETIPITDNYRLLVEYDSDVENPRLNWDHLTGFVTVGRHDYLAVAPVHDDTAQISRAHTLFDSGICHVDTHEVVSRWARIFHNMHVEYDYRYRGYWFVDPAGLNANWPELTGEESFQKQAEVIEQERETYRQWAEGEVFGVMLEKRTLWGKLSDDGSTLLQGDGTTTETWETVDSLWGNYLGDSYTAEQVALEHFNMPDDVEAILKERTSK